MKILFTSVGRRVELIQLFKEAAGRLNVELEIFGADITELAPALFFCDKKVIVPLISDKAYIPTLIDICRRNSIDALIPTIDTDLLLLSENAARFDAVGTKVFISAPEKIAVCRDKNYTSDFFVSCGLKAPKTYNDCTKYDGGFPCFIKPKDGSSSIDAYKISNFDELYEFAKRVDDYVIQPFVDGEEYTVDVFCSFDGSPVYITPRKRIAVRAGEVLKTEIACDEKIIGECKKIIEKFKPVGAITVQLIKDKKTDENYYIEINPRYGGGAPHSIMAGADSPAAVIRILKGENSGYVENAAENGAFFSRFDQSIRLK